MKYFPTPEDAIEAAEAAARDLSNADGFYRFDGDETCEECPGWDGLSRRCECGNRRVYWEPVQYNEGWHTNAVAY